MKKILIILISSFGFSFIFAQSTMQVNENVVIKSPFDLRFLMSAHADLNKYNNMINGYRIQLLSSSDREAVYAKKNEVYSIFPDFQGYVIYDQPYYKLRMGDFTTRLEARKYLDEIITAFPTAFIVADKVKVYLKEK
ncbi:MAG: SPOR domain-containing protein [Chitinophagales bacterium]|nr:SPOR domain-containing protein [Chitinophagales bacterium]